MLIYEKVNLNSLQNMILFAISDKDGSYFMYYNILSRFGKKIIFYLELELFCEKLKIEYFF